MLSYERGDYVKAGTITVPDTKRERCVILGEYIIDNEATVRSTAKVDPHLAGKVKEVLQKNKDERHIRGGLATKLKYQNGSK